MLFFQLFIVFTWFTKAVLKACQICSKLYLNTSLLRLWNLETMNRLKKKSCSQITQFFQIRSIFFHKVSIIVPKLHAPKMVTVNRTALLCFSLHACFFILLIRTFSLSYLHWGLDFWVYEKCPLLSDILICLSPTFCYASFLSLCYPSAFTSFPALALLFLLLSYPSSSLCTFSSSYHCRFLFTPSNTPFTLIACLTATLSLFFQPSPPSLYPSLFFSPLGILHNGNWHFWLMPSSPSWPFFPRSFLKLPFSVNLWSCFLPLCPCSCWTSLTKKKL